MAWIQQGECVPTKSETAATGMEEGAVYFEYEMGAEQKPPLKVIARPLKGNSLLRVWLSKTEKQPNKAHSDCGGSSRPFTQFDMADAKPGTTYYVGVKSMDKVAFQIEIRNGQWRELARQDDSVGSTPRSSRLAAQEPLEALPVNAYGTWTDKAGNSFTGEWKDEKPFSGSGVYVLPGKGSNNMIGCRYDGEFTNGGGTGTITYPDGGTYVGEWKGLLRFGQGKYTAHHDRDSYEGGWIDDVRSGEGSMRYQSNEVFTGQWSGDRRLDGEGTMVYNDPEGREYRGQFVDLTRAGSGVMTYANKDEYSGEWKAGKRVGTGEFTDGRAHTSCKGKWKDDKPVVSASQKLEFTFPNGDKYIGPMDEGFPLKDVDSTLEYKKGHKYTGRWWQFQRHGQGTMAFSDGSRYEGEWKYSQRQGKGSMTFADGAVYLGEFKGNLSEGEGKLTRADKKSTYSGQWLHGMRHGKGYLSETAFHSLARIGGGSGGSGQSSIAVLTYDGEWESDLFHGQGTATVQGQCVYKGLWERGQRHGRGELAAEGADRAVKLLAVARQAKANLDSAIEHVKKSLPPPPPPPAPAPADEEADASDKDADKAVDSAAAAAAAEAAEAGQAVGGVVPPLVDEKVDDAAVDDAVLEIALQLMYAGRVQQAGWEDPGFGDARIPCGVAEHAAAAASVSAGAQRYCGEWCGGQPVRGAGEYHHEDGSLYSGAWLQETGPRSAAAADDAADAAADAETVAGAGSSTPGLGVIVGAHGDVYCGQWKDGFKHGLGLLQDHLGNHHVGRWEEGRRCGPCKVRYTNTDVFDGGFEDDVRAGAGCLVTSEGDRLECEWEGGKPVKAAGPAVSAVYVRDDDGEPITPIVLSGSFMGVGGRAFDGELRNRRPYNGFGFYTLLLGPAGDSSSDSSKDKSSGGSAAAAPSPPPPPPPLAFGALALSPHTAELVYEGRWTEDSGEGTVIHYYADRDAAGERRSVGSYQGQWAALLLDGVGTMSYSDGAKYEGQWKAGRRHGDGVCMYYTAEALVAKAAVEEKKPLLDRMANQIKLTGARLAEKFAVVDISRDGELNKEEMSVLCSKGLAMDDVDQDDLDGFMLAVDIDRSGAVSFKELQTVVMKRMRDIEKESRKEKKVIKTVAVSSSTRTGTYTGQWDADKRHGKGSLAFTNGDVYEGSWVDDLKHGAGVVTFANGDAFTGNWVCDTPLITDDAKGTYVMTRKVAAEPIVVESSAPTASGEPMAAHITLPNHSAWVFETAANRGLESSPASGDGVVAATAESDQAATSSASAEPAAGGAAPAAPAASGPPAAGLHASAPAEDDDAEFEPELDVFEASEDWNDVDDINVT